MAHVHAEALHRAAELLGGVDKLRERLRVPADDLKLWMDAHASPPTDVFLLAVDVISGSLPSPRSVKEIHERARRLRRESEFLRESMARTRERAAKIRAAVLETSETRRMQPAPQTAAQFLGRRFSPGEGREMVEAALDAVLDSASTLTGNLQLACPEGLRIVAHRGFDKPFLDYFSIVEHRGSACGAAAQDGRRVVVADVDTDPIFAGTQAREVVLQAGCRAVQSTPLLGKSGELLGVISTHYPLARKPTERELLGIDIVARRTAYWLDGGSA